MFTIDPGLPEPPYEQLRAQIEQQRASGELPTGYRLPPVRHLATELGLAANTVARTYKELEAAGLIETRGRKGSFVTGTAESAGKVAAAAARQYVATARSLGIRDDEALAILADALGEST